MEKEVEITKENYRDYVKLYDRRMMFSKKEYVCAFFLDVIVLSLFYPLCNLIVSIKNTGLTVLFSSIMCIGGFIIICNTPKLMEKIHERKVNKEFPHLNTKIETYELRKMLEKEKLLVNGRINLKEYEEKKQEFIKKCDDIKENIKTENRRDYSSLKYNTGIQDEQLEKVKGKVKKLVKNR